MKRYKIIALFCVLLMAAQLGCAQKVVTTASLLKQLTDPESIVKWPDPFYRELQASSYDRRSILPDQPMWFANNDASQYIRTEEMEGRKENVMLDVDGPGAIIRFWLTTFKREGTLRIYFDGRATPEITIPAYDLMKIPLSLKPGLLTPHSSYEPKEKGGSTLYLPMPFKKHCKITFEDKALEKQPRYYQINYRKYAVGTAVKTFSLKEFYGLSKLVSSTSERLMTAADRSSGVHTFKKEVLVAGKSMEVKLPAGPSAIRGLNILLSTADNPGYERALHSAIIRIAFDDEETVFCPLDLFSGSGIGGKPIQSWYRTVNGQHEMTSRWVMPYQRSARITIENTGSQEIRLSLDAISSSFNWDNRTLYFHADWKDEKEIKVINSETDKLVEWNFNVINGKGVFAGETISLFNHMHKWYGEGDQKLWIDGEKFPSEYGTGTEDYFNTSWAPVVVYQTPFANATRADHADSYGDNTFTRTRNLDVVPFQNHFRYSLEMQGWDNGLIDASIVTYWYGFKETKGQQ